MNCCFVSFLFSFYKEINDALSEQLFIFMQQMVRVYVLSGMPCGLRKNAKTML